MSLFRQIIRLIIRKDSFRERQGNTNMDFGPCHTEMVNVACCDNQKQLIWQPIRFHISVEYAPEY